MRCALHISYIFLRSLGADTVSGVEGGVLFLNWTRHFTWAHLHAVQVISASVTAYLHSSSLSLVNIWASRVGPYLHFLFISHCSRCLGNSGPIFFFTLFPSLYHFNFFERGVAAAQTPRGAKSIISFCHPFPSFFCVYSHTFSTLATNFSRGHKGWERVWFSRVFPSHSWCRVSLVKLLPGSWNCPWKFPKPSRKPLSDVGVQAQ